MEKKYSHLLSPLFIRNKFVKNRMALSRSTPTFAFGAHETDPLEMTVTYSGVIAANGAAIVTCSCPKWPTELNNFDPSPGHYLRASNEGNGLTHHDTEITFNRIAEAVHNHGSLALMSMMDIEPGGWEFSEMPEAYLDQMVEEFAQKARIYKSVGFDGGCFYMSYGSSILARALSPIYNRREDKYGKRTALSMAIFKRVREVCGEDFIIEAQASGTDVPGGFTIDDVVEYAREWDGLVDILQVRAVDAEMAHPVGFNSRPGEHITLAYSEKIKAAVKNMLVAPVGGFQDPEENDRYIAEGKADLIYMARAYICDFDYYKKILAGRGDDVVPCIRCNKCHTRFGDPDAGCSVNPLFYLSLDLNWKNMYLAVAEPKKVAVMGGGPAGMKAALTASERGHQVTLFEKTGVLGGQLLHSDYASFKWPLKNYKDYLVRKLKESDVEICMNCAPTPEEIEREGFQALIYAVGAEPKLPPIPGAEGPHSWKFLDVYGHEAELGHRVVVIGGSETSVETAAYLSMCGHRVTVLTRAKRIAHDSQPVHYREMFETFWKELKNFDYYTETSVSSVQDGIVEFRDETGAVHTIAADDVVLCGGMRSRNEDAVAYAQIVDYFRIVGDCKKVDNVRTATKAAYVAAMML